VSRLILQILDSDAQARVEIHAAEPILPAVGDTITFEIAPGEVVTRYVDARGAIRYTSHAVIVELRTLFLRVILRKARRPKRRYEL